LKLAVLSDVHGNLPALEAVLADTVTAGIDGILVAGDYIGGPQPCEVIQRLHDLGAIMISGNSDTNLIRLRTGRAPQAWYQSLQFALLRWGDRHLDQSSFDLLQSLPEQRVVALEGTAPIRMVHGSVRDQYESIFPDRDPEILDIALAQAPEAVLICGHTHIPWIEKTSGRLAINPGAVCGPLNGEIGAQYAILSWEDGGWQAEPRLIEYDLALIRRAFRDSGLLREGGALARAFLRSIETGQNVAEWFLDHAYRLASEISGEDVPFVPDEIWIQAESRFHWDAERDPGAS
jgi:putative phosphoesterase